MAKKQEEKLDGKEQRGTSESGSASERAGEGTTKGQPTGNETSGGTNENNGESGSSQRTSEGTDTGNRGSKEETKRNILANIRNKRAKRHGEHGDPKPFDVKGNDEGNEGNNGTDERRNESNDGTSTRTDSGFSGDNGETNDHHTSTSGSSGSSETNSNGRVKKKGIKLDIPTLPSSTDSKKPITVEKEEEETLTQKEAKELKPRMIDALTVFFGGMDKTISMTTKKAEARNVQIWSTITKDEIEIMATAMVETAQRVPVVALATRGITRNYQKYQMGIILLPRFIQTTMHYYTNGFGLNMGAGQ